MSLPKIIHFPYQLDRHICFDPILNQFLRLPRLGGWDILKRESVFYCTAWKIPILVLENFRLPKGSPTQPVQIFHLQNEEWIEIHHTGDIASEEQDRILYSQDSQSLIQIANRRPISTGSEKLKSDNTDFSSLKEITGETTGLIINRLSLVQDPPSIHETNIRLGNFPGSNPSQPLVWKQNEAICPGSFCLEVGEDIFRKQLVFFLEREIVSYREGKFAPLGKLKNITLSNTSDSGRIFISKDKMYFCSRIGRTSDNVKLGHDPVEIYSVNLDGTGCQKISPPGALSIGSLDYHSAKDQIMGIHWEMTAEYPTPEFMIYENKSWKESPNTVDRFSAFRLSTDHIYLFQECKIQRKTHYRIAKVSRNDFPGDIELSRIHEGKVSLEYLPPFPKFYEMGNSKNISINDFFTIDDDLYLLTAPGAIWILDQSSKQWKQIIGPHENYEPRDDSAIFLETNVQNSKQYKLYVYGGSQVDMRTNSAQKIGKELWILDFQEKSWTQEKLSGKIPALFFPGYQRLAQRDGHFVKDASTGDYIVTGGELVTKKIENGDIYRYTNGKWSKE